MFGLPPWFRFLVTVPDRLAAAAGRTHPLVRVVQSRSEQDIVQALRTKFVPTELLVDERGTQPPRHAGTGV